MTVDLGANVVLLTVFGAAGLLDRLLHSLQHLVAIDTLVAGYGVGDLQQLRASVGNGAFHNLPVVFSSFTRQLGCKREAAIKSSVRTSRARATSESGKRVSPASVTSRTSPSAVPRRRPRKRLRPPKGRANSILASKPLKRS